MKMFTCEKSTILEIESSMQVKCFSCIKQPRVRHKGFTLVITISMMVLLAIIAVGMLSLSSISLRNSAAQSAQTTARANARMAMMIALGNLQRNAGIDQSVTMNAEVMNASQSANPYWIGVTNSAAANRPQDPKASQVRWLVSGNNPDPSTTLTASNSTTQGNALLVARFLNGAQQQDLLAPVVNVTQGSQLGRYAYWISDEGAKARVDIEKPTTAPQNDAERYARANSPLEYGLVNMDQAAGNWQKFAPLPTGTVSKSRLLSLSTVALVANQNNLPQQYFHDLTTGGHGLPVNCDAGGMKADLSLIFDRSQANKNYSTPYFGSTATASASGGINRIDFAPASNPSLFFLSENISNAVNAGVGPNWGNLWNYATMWQNLSGQELPIVQATPSLEADLRFKNWPPYTRHDAGGAFLRDIQHTNSPVTPVASMFQMGFRFNSILQSPTQGSTPAQYRAQIVVQPLVGIWNPYNVKIRNATYTFEWALYPYFEFSFTTPNNPTPQINQLWMRNTWFVGGGTQIPSDASANSRAGGRYIQLVTPNVDLEPGEFRLFSVQAESDLGSGPRSLVSGWSERGGFRLNLKNSSNTDLILPEGSRIWFDRIFLQDTQFAGTTQAVGSQPPRFSIQTDRVSSAWFTLKSSGGTLSRCTETWNGGIDPSTVGPVTVPEPILPKANRVKYLIQDVANGNVNPHIATWAFNLRTTNQVENPDQTQTLRGWIDCNPRAMVTNSRWDGSNVSSAGQRTGWHTTSPWLGAYSFPSRGIGDGIGGNRGLVSEAGSAISEPQVNRAGGRYQGYGGASNTLAGGKNHVIIYDIPRAPLSSIGQFQHAQIGRYNFEPGFIVGNSYANPRIPLNATQNPNFGGFSGLNITDVSYDVNRRLWDGFFFSTLGADYLNRTGTSLNATFDMKRLVSGQQTLPNPRMQFFPIGGDVGIDEIISGAGNRAPEAIAARIRITGAFNVNSTSKNAWKAVLSSMGSSELPVVNREGTAVSWSNNGGIRFNRFGSVLSQAPYLRGQSGQSDGFWKGWRQLSDDELDQLATEIVNEVKARGPFRSMAEFVNRNPFSTNRPENQRKGALQAALDRTVNAGLPNTVGEPAVQPNGNQFSAAMNGESSAAGNAGYLQQGDILQSLGPILQARSDYFRIRTCGEALDSTGKVLARAWCEAFVQRSSPFTDPTDLAHTKPAVLNSNVNRAFGRRFDIVSFRWLNQNEI